MKSEPRPQTASLQPTAVPPDLASFLRAWRWGLRGPGTLLLLGPLPGVRETQMCFVDGATPHSSPPRALEGDGDINKKGPGVREPGCRSGGCGTRRRLEHGPEGAVGQVCPPQGAARLGAGAGPCWLAQPFPGAEAWARGLPPWGSMCPGFGVGGAGGREAGPPRGPLRRCCACWARRPSGREKAASAPEAGATWGPTLGTGAGPARCLASPHLRAGLCAGS